MKRRILVGLMVVMALNFSSRQVFAQEQVQQTRVYVDGDGVNFTVDPLNEKGTTLVQFKPVFEKLGLEVAWDKDTQTVIGTTYNLNIQLTIGSKTVLVNGEEKQLPVAPKIVKDVTMIPLRFVGEASGRDVSWDFRTKTVYIASTKEQILHVVDQNLIYSQNEDLDGYISTLDPSTPGIEQIKDQVGQINAAYDLKYEYENIEINSVEKEKASVKLTQSTTKVSGPEFGNNKINLIMDLIKVNGEWKLTTSKILKIEYLK
ncbi:MAG: stalk domain-containing protein [Paenibacillaceae bacterium]